MNRDKVEIDLKSILKFTKEDIEKLQIFHDELLKFNKRYNLISKSTEKDIWHRHILDSAQLVKFVDFNREQSISDMGSGAGFPGVVLAIFNKNPGFHVKLYEKSSVKCDFLDNIRNKIDVEYDIFGDYKNEEISSYYVISRAFKKLEEIIRISRETIKVNHRLIILKGRNAENEINKLKPYENFIYKTEESITDSESKILFIEIKK
jgi:16S rRNA (guanine527-N7)-methyltransferase|tara:strand:- start:28 stop:645 length:618 start_codon:yes stop_codon:yes gene_type:complete